MDYGARSLMIGHGRGIKIYGYYHKPTHTIELCFKKHMLPSFLKKTTLAQSSPSKPNGIQDINLILKTRLEQLLLDSLLSNNMPYLLFLSNPQLTNHPSFITLTPHLHRPKIQLGLAIVLDPQL